MRWRIGRAHSAQNVEMTKRGGEAGDTERERSPGLQRAEGRALERNRRPHDTRRTRGARRLRRARVERVELLLERPRRVGLPSKTRLSLRESVAGPRASSPAAVVDDPNSSLSSLEPAGRPVAPLIADPTRPRGFRGPQHGRRPRRLAVQDALLVRWRAPDPHVERAAT